MAISMWTTNSTRAPSEASEESDELCSSQWSSSSSLRAPTTTTIPNIWFDSGTSVRPVSSNYDRSISSRTATDHATDYKPSNSSLVNQNFDPKLFSSNWAIYSKSSSDATILNRCASESLLTISHPSVLLPSPPLLKPLSSVPPSIPLQLGEIRNDNSLPPSPLPLAETELAAKITAGNLTFDIPDLPAIDAEDTDNNSHINSEILHNTSTNTAIIAYYLNHSDRNCSALNHLTNFIQENKMKQVTSIVSPINNAQASSVIDYSDCWDRDQNEIIVNGLLDTITNEETCSLNSTSISIDHSRDSILDFSICSNPIDEAAIMEEQLAASGELSDDIPVMARSTATTLSSYTPKDTGHSLTNRTIFTTATAVASTTGSNCQPVSPSASSFITASLPPLLFNAPPIASLEDLTSGEQNSDITTARSDFATSSATNFDFNRVRKDDLKEERKTGRGRIEQGVGNGKDADDDDNDDVNGRSDYYRQTSASTTIKRYIIRSGWFFRPYQHARPLN
ncbi:Apical junction molecule [Dirofilaria immitis]